MKRIMISGANSYIGTSFERWMNQWKEQYIVDTVDMKNDLWREKDFSVYDVIFHVAGIAHVDVKKASKETQELYYRVNRDLAIETATKAKKEGVRQFIFMSSIIVYGDSSCINRERVIDTKEIPNPSNFYGDSKLQAENGIKSLEDSKFKVVILRPPMIYGKGSKGNFAKMNQYASKLPFFPDINNHRSMLYINNLCEFIHLMIEYEESGLFFPQNTEYVRTSEMVKLISEAYGKKLVLLKIFNPLLYILSNFTGVINKAFGNLVYEKSMSEYYINYRVKNLKESINETVMGDS